MPKPHFEPDFTSENALINPIYYASKTPELWFFAILGHTFSLHLVDPIPNFMLLPLSSRLFYSLTESVRYEGCS
jgi:hypothetical protein